MKFSSQTVKVIALKVFDNVCVRIKNETYFRGRLVAIFQLSQLPQESLPNHLRQTATLALPDTLVLAIKYVNL
jgi:hypothetical protein